MDNAPAIALENILVDYPIYAASSRSLRKQISQTLRGNTAGGEANDQVVVALRDISFSIPLGSSVGLIGLNGAGKSTMLKLMGGLIEPTQGRVIRNGTVSALLNVGVGMEPELSGMANIRRVGILRGLSTADIEEMTPDIIEFADLGRFIHLPVRTYSSGMRMRLSFAIATTRTPDILLLDEVFNVGDRAFRERASDRIRTLVERSKTFVLSSHSEGLIREFCTTCIYLEHGTLRAFGETREVMRQYRTDTRRIQRDMERERKRALRARKEALEAATSASA